MRELNEKRFYKNVCDPFENEPTRDKFEIIETDDKGRGVISLIEFKPGDIVFAFAGQEVDKQSLMTLQIQPERYLLDDIIMGRILHSCDPNMSCDMQEKKFTCVKTIHPHDFLTMDYETTEDELFRNFTYNMIPRNSFKIWIIYYVEHEHEI